MSTFRLFCGAVGALAGLHAQAQAPGAPAEPTRAAAQPAVERQFPFASTLRGYRPFSDERLADWREANDTVLHIGGWQAYGREARDAIRVPPAAAPPAQPSQSPQSGATPKADHEGHHGARQ